MRPLTAREILRTLREGADPGVDALSWFARGLADDTVSDAQAGAFAMAICQRRLTEAGRVALTLAMRDSGDVLHWDLPGPVVDKHSTGGIGDSVSLLLAPALAACGVFVPMIAGRGLGHTGGTLDKLEAIPGYTVAPGVERLRQVVRETGCAIVGAGERLAPADRRLYAVRDVTGTVESIDLITASILSKKLAEGLGALVLDVKAGSGAFMPTPDAARALARALVETATGAGCRTCALVTDMDQPLASTAGNALEVAEVMEALAGARPPARLRTLTVALGGELLALCGAASDTATGERAIARALDGGEAAARFGAMVAALGGPPDFLARWREYLPEAPVLLDVPAPAAGRVRAIDTRTVGMAVVALGGGRQREGDAVDPRVGFSALAHIGDGVGPGQPLGRVHAANEGAAARAVAALQSAYEIGEPCAPPPLVLARVA